MFWPISLRFIKYILSKWPMIFGSRVNPEIELRQILISARTIYHHSMFKDNQNNNMDTYSYGCFSSKLIFLHFAPSILDTSLLSIRGFVSDITRRCSTEKRIKPFFGRFGDNLLFFFTVEIISGYFKLYFRPFLL